MVGVVLVVIVHVAIVEVHVPRVVVAILSGRPVVVRLGGSPDGPKVIPSHFLIFKDSTMRFEESFAFLIPHGW